MCKTKALNLLGAREHAEIARGSKIAASDMHNLYMSLLRRRRLGDLAQSLRAGNLFGERRFGMAAAGSSCVASRSGKMCLGHVGGSSLDQVRNGPPRNAAFTGTWLQRGASGGR
jgi:hypothetical protein